MSNQLGRMAIRIDEGSLARADELIPVVKKLHGNGPTTRSDVLREAIERGLRELGTIEKGAQVS